MGVIVWTDVDSVNSIVRVGRRRLLRPPTCDPRRRRPL